MSKLPFELLLALRYLRPKRTFVSIITLISIIGVMLGVAVLIIVISVMSGFDHDLREKVFGFKSHLMISGADDAPLKNYAAIEQLFRPTKMSLAFRPSSSARNWCNTRSAPTNRRSWPRRICAALTRRRKAA